VVWRAGARVRVASAGPSAAPFESQPLSPVILNRAARGGDAHPRLRESMDHVPIRGV